MNRGKFKAVRMYGLNTNLRKKWYFHKIVYKIVQKVLEFKGQKPNP